MTQKRVMLGRNQTALEAAVSALAVGPEHSALVEAARSLALLVDQPGGFFDDKLWREYRLAVQNLMGATSNGGSDAFNQFLETLRAEVGDSKNSE